MLADPPTLPHRTAGPRWSAGGSTAGGRPPRRPPDCGARLPQFWGRCSWCCLSCALAPGSRASAATSSESPASSTSTTTGPEAFPGYGKHYGFDSIYAYRRLFAFSAAQSARHVTKGSIVYLSCCAIRSTFSFLTTEHSSLPRTRTRRTLVKLGGEAWWRPGTTPLDDKVVDYPCIGRLGAAVERLTLVAPWSQCILCSTATEASPAGAVEAAVSLPRP